MSGRVERELNNIRNLIDEFKVIAKKMSPKDIRLDREGSNISSLKEIA